MGNRITENKGRSKQNRSNDFQETKVSPVHIRLDINTAVSYEKGILNAKQSLIKIIQQVKKYRASREDELDKKAQIRDALKALHVILGKLERDDLPKMKQEEKTRALRAEKKVEHEEEPVIEPPRIEMPEIKIEEHKPSSLEKELMDIKKRLENLNTIEAVSKMAEAS